jgi:hypothetical protein
MSPSQRTELSVLNPRSSLASCSLTRCASGDSSSGRSVAAGGTRRPDARFQMRFRQVVEENFELVAGDHDVVQCTPLLAHDKASAAL